MVLAVFPACITLLQMDGETTFIGIMLRKINQLPGFVTLHFICLLNIYTTQYRKRFPLLQNIFQDKAGTMQTGFDRTNADIKNAGNLFSGIPFRIM